MLKQNVCRQCLLHSMYLINSHRVTIVELGPRCWMPDTWRWMSLLSITCLVIAVLAFTSLPGHTVSTMVHSCALYAVTYSSKTMFFSLTSFWCFFSKPVFQVIDPLYLCHPGIVNCLGMVEPQCMTPNSLRKYFNYILASWSAIYNDAIPLQKAWVFHSVSSWLTSSPGSSGFRSWGSGQGWWQWRWWRQLCPWRGQWRAGHRCR